MAEDVGGAGVLVDPLDVEAIVAGIDEAVSRREELVPLGRERARLYTWDAAVEAALAAYRRTLE